MPFSHLSTLDRAPYRIVVIDADNEPSITLAGLAQPLRLAAKKLGSQRLQVDVIRAERMVSLAQDERKDWHLALLVADDAASPMLLPEQLRQLIERLKQARYWGAVGSAVLCLARAGALDGVRVALPWALYADADDIAERLILTPNLFEIDGQRLTCCGGAASIDFSLTLIEALFGATLQSQVKEALCVDRVRGHAERQSFALGAHFANLQPTLLEALSLMQANIEEPLATDDVARLVGLSRRQLERLFTHYLGRSPARYYLELRLQRARHLLIHSHHSIVQIGLMCGFSSASHFSTAFGTLFEITPREERQRRLLSGDPQMDGK